MLLSPSRFLWLLGALVVGFGTATIISLRTTAGLSPRPADAHSSEATLEELRTARAQLAARQPGTSELEQLQADLLTLRAEQATLATLRDEYQRAMIAATTRAAAPVPIPSRPPPNQASPEAAVQSVISAVNDGETEELASLIDFDEATRAEAEAFLASLPEDVQETFGSAAHLVAHVMTAKTHLDFASTQVEALTLNGGNQASVRLRMVRKQGPERTATLDLHRTNEGWRLRVPRTVVEGYRALVTGVMPANASP